MFGQDSIEYDILWLLHTFVTLRDKNRSNYVQVLAVESEYGLFNERVSGYRVRTARASGSEILVKFSVE